MNIKKHKKTCHNGLFYTDEGLCPKRLNFFYVHRHFKEFSINLKVVIYSKWILNVMTLNTCHLWMTLCHSLIDREWSLVSARHKRVGKIHVQVFDLYYVNTRWLTRQLHRKMTQDIKPIASICKMLKSSLRSLIFFVTAAHRLNSSISHWSIKKKRYNIHFANLQIFSVHQFYSVHCEEM